MANVDRPSYCDWETSWWWTSSVRYSLPKALQMTYVELCWKIHDDGGATKKDLAFLARFLMDTEDNVRTILELPHFYTNENGTLGHRSVDVKLGEQKERRNAGKRAIEARWNKENEKKNTARNTARNTGGTTSRNTGPNRYEGGLEGVPERPPASVGTPSPGGRGCSAPAPSGRGAGAAGVVKPVVPGARVPTVWLEDDPESFYALSEDGREWIATEKPSIGERIAVTQQHIDRTPTLRNGGRR